MIRLDGRSRKLSDRFFRVDDDGTGMTELLYLPDDDGTTEFTSQVTEATTEYIVLEGTYFYPEGGGQPPDHGTLSWEDGHTAVTDVRKNHGDVRHYVESMTGDPPEEGTVVEGTVNTDRRERLSRMHTAQHVVSRVVLDEYGATTAGNQIHSDRSRIDFEPASFGAEDLDTIQRLANEAIDRDYPVRKENRPRAMVEESVDEGRALLHLIPDSVDPLRVVEIESFDMCPCGGTHVDSLGAIGRIEITDRTTKGRGTERIEFELV